MTRRPSVPRRPRLGTENDPLGKRKAMSGHGEGDVEGSSVVVNGREEN